MKKAVFALSFVLSLTVISLSAFSKNSIQDTTEPCLKWKKICTQEKEPVQKNDARACYRCLRPQHYGFDLYNTPIDTNTCNPKTAYYYTTMGYRCFKPTDAALATEKTRTVCTEKCVKYES